MYKRQFQTTAVLAYKPHFFERPLSCSLQSLEVFSCALASEKETALSIIDPLTITMELSGGSSSKNQLPPHMCPKISKGFLEVPLLEVDEPPTLEVIAVFVHEKLVVVFSGSDTLRMRKI